VRALAADTAGALQAAVDGLELPWTVELRTGDSSSALKQRQRTRLPSALVTTPESLSVLLSYPESRKLFAGLRCAIVDEWHELLGGKRGVQVELALARLAQWTPELRVWGLSATLGNLSQALDVLTSPIAVQNLATRRVVPPPRLICSGMDKPLHVETVIPPDIERFPWAGHLGLKLLPEVAQAVRQARSTLVFTNTRAQTEIWFQALVDNYPEFAGEIALHHGSLEASLRSQVEERLRDGRLRCVVCTSSLDLGVDFAPVDQVIQIGSPKGVGRLMQRAGRSGHQPGAASRILCVPAHAFELVEFAAARAALDAGAIEARAPLERPLDVLVQHLVTVALGGGFTASELLDEVRTTYAYRNLSDDDWRWAIDFVTSGGAALRAYTHYGRVVFEHGRYTVASAQIARQHRLSIGTITSEGMVQVAFVKGGVLGAVEESFIARLRPGDQFVFAGRLLELVRVKDMAAYVRLAPSGRGIIPRWYGGRMPLSTQLADAVQDRLAEAGEARYTSAEMAAVRPLLELQAAWSRLPSPDQLLVEGIKTRDGHYLFFYPWAGRPAHEGLGTLLAYRLSRREPRTVSAFATDYGFALLSPDPFVLSEVDWRTLLSPDNLVEDVLACINTTELARRQFRDVARVAGLIFTGFPGAHKTARQLQTSTGLLFDVFRQYDPDNLLIVQAEREVLQQQLDLMALSRTLARMAQAQLLHVSCRRLTPFAFPIWAEQMRTQVSSEKWSDRIQRMVMQLEQAAQQN
jgi:ATP-dependent Lhr-like helicase